MKINRTLLTLLAIASGLLAGQAQTFTTNNGVIVGTPGGTIPPLSARTNMLPWNRTNSGWNDRTNGAWNTRTNMPWNRTNSFRTNNLPPHVPISSNIPSTSIQPPDSSLPPMTNAPGQRFQPVPGTIQPGQNPNNPNNPNMNNGQPRQPNQPANPTTPTAPPVRK